MDFGLSDEQRLLQDTVEQFLAKENDATRLRARFDAEEAFDAGFWRGMAELGLAGLVIPESQGGTGLPLLDVALVAEVLGRFAAPGPFLGHTLAALALALGGSPEQQRRWLPRLATGDAIGSVAFAEEGVGWQPEDWRLAAGPTLRGEKQHVLLAAQACDHDAVEHERAARGEIAGLEQELAVVGQQFPEHGIPDERAVDVLPLPCRLDRIGLDVDEIHV